VTRRRFPQRAGSPSLNGGGAAAAVPPGGNKYLSWKFTSDERREAALDHTGFMDTGNWLLIIHEIYTVFIYIKTIL